MRDQLCISRDKSITHQSHECHAKYHVCARDKPKADSNPIKAFVIRLPAGFRFAIFPPDLENNFFFFAQDERLRVNSPQHTEPLTHTIATACRHGYLGDVYRPRRGRDAMEYCRSRGTGSRGTGMGLDFFFLSPPYFAIIRLTFYFCSMISSKFLYYGWNLLLICFKAVTIVLNTEC